MQAGRSLAQERFALPGRVLDTELHDGFIVAVTLLELLDQRPRQRRAAQRDEPFELRGAENRQNARDDGDRHAVPGQEVPALQVVAIVEEQLRDHEVRAVIDLHLQPVPVLMLAVRAGDMSFREAGHADRERTGLANQSHQLVGVLEPAVRFHEPAAAVRRIAAQRQDVLDPQLTRLVQHPAGLVDGRVDACQMRHRRNPELPLDPVDDRERLLARAPAGAVGDGTEVGVELSQSRDRLLQQHSLRFLRLRRKELEGEDRPSGRPRRGEDVVDVLDQRRIVNQDRGRRKRDSRFRAPAGKVAPRYCTVIVTMVGTVNAPCRVPRAIDERIGPGESRRRRVHERAVGVQRERPVRRPGHEDRRQRVSVRIEIVDEHARRRDRQLVPAGVVYESGSASNSGWLVSPVIVTVAIVDFFRPSDAL